MTRKNLILLHMNTKNANQPGLPDSLINAFISQSLGSVTSKLVICKFSKFKRVSIAEHRFSRDEMHIVVHSYL